MVNSNKLNKRIEIEEPTRTANALNEEVLTWSRYCYDFASIEPKNSTEAKRANQTVSVTSYIIKIRWRVGITSDMRIKYTSPDGVIYFQIQGIINKNEANEVLELSCMVLK